MTFVSEPFVGLISENSCWIYNVIRNPLHSALYATLLICVVDTIALAGIKPPAAPEIALGSMASAVALLSGGVAILADKFRRKK